MEPKDAKIARFLELANKYPSPHNGQPIRLTQLSDTKFEAYFMRERGLQSTPISYIFSFVSMGVFLEHATAAANAIGHTLTYTQQLPAEVRLRGTGHIRFANLYLQLDTHAPDEKEVIALLFRQTSRKKYTEGLPNNLTSGITDIAGSVRMKLAKLSDRQARQAIWLNQRAVFDDMFVPAVNAELDHWLRYTPEEKKAKKDGLAYDCMELNGKMMRYIIHHPHWLRKPVLSTFIKQYYLRTMTDRSDVFYMMAPFATEAQSFEVGTVIMKIWLALSRQGYYLHPFGTIMSNEAAHKDFMRMAGVTDESRERNYLVFIFRAGKSEPPVRSLRLPYEQHLIMR